MGVVAVDPKEVEADVVFSALPADEAKKAEADFARAGFVVASNASAYRFDPDVPLMIPECNSDHLGLIDVQQKKRGWDGYIVTNPNCTTIMFALTLKPLMPMDIKRVIVASMQAVSGAGYEGVPSMAILGNVIPFISGEEEKVEKEAQKILGTFDGDEIVDAPFDVSASCHRVPVMDGHTEALWVEMASNPNPAEVREAFLKFDPGLSDLPTEPEKPLIVRDEPDRPQPRLATRARTTAATGRPPQVRRTARPARSRRSPSQATRPPTITAATPSGYRWASPNSAPSATAPSVMRPRPSRPNVSAGSAVILRTAASSESRPASRT